MFPHFLPFPVLPYWWVPYLTSAMVMLGTIGVAVHLINCANRTWHRRFEADTEEKRVLTTSLATALQRMVAPAATEHLEEPADPTKDRPKRQRRASLRQSPSPEGVPADNGKRSPTDSNEHKHHLDLGAAIVTMANELQLTRAQFRELKEFFRKQAAASAKAVNLFATKLLEAKLLSRADARAIGFVDLEEPGGVAEPQDVAGGESTKNDVKLTEP